MSRRTRLALAGLLGLVLIVGLTVGLLNGFQAGHTGDQLRGLAIIGALVAACVAGKEIWEQSTWGHPSSERCS